jgi:hypothetical protein
VTHTPTRLTYVQRLVLTDSRPGESTAVDKAPPYVPLSSLVCSAGLPFEAHLEHYATHIHSAHLVAIESQALDELRRIDDAGITFFHASASLLVDANARIGVLTRRVRDLEVRLEDLSSKASISP